MPRGAAQHMSLLVPRCCLNALSFQDAQFKQNFIASAFKINYLAHVNGIPTSDFPHAEKAGATFRRARVADLPFILELLADDAIAAEREGGTTFDAERYITAFDNIDKDPNQLLAVIDVAGEVVGTLQLTFIPGLLRGGAWRGQIEAVRVSKNHRGGGLGQAFILWAIEVCRERECLIVQLTTDRRRQDAHRFYERLRFESTHFGYKLILQ